MSKLLKEITYKTKQTLKNYDIVLPSDYRNTFKKFAKEHNIEIEDEVIVLENFFNDKKRLDTVIDQTSKNLKELSNSAKSAQEAISEQDINRLKNVQESMSELQQKINFLQHELFTDSLTQVNNRKWLMDCYLKEDKFPTDGSLAFIDLNKFKQINDNYGHLAGDLVLRFLADYLKRKLNFLGRHIIRYAGDEFIVIFDSKDKRIDFEQTMVMIQNKIQKKVLKLKNNSNLNLTLSFSFGLVEFKKGNAFSEVVVIADERMYKNKVQLRATA